ncbi:hypothetical protein AVEN_140953-1 [Araneus ventricosus]|uniref:Uncharacterized protein n=1 Tax=Araneus ventricosus TaxID=182803 RepID=A0A4Y2GAK5_ARAVE|nr:hypothetical protein AVEN_140953-1 [Araneus ventricosus]
MSEFRRPQIATSVWKRSDTGDDYFDSSHFRGSLAKASDFLDGFQPASGFPKQIPQKVIQNKIHDKAGAPLTVNRAQNRRKDYFRTFNDYKSIPGDKYRKLDYLTTLKEKGKNDFEPFSTGRKQMTRYHDEENGKKNQKLIIPQTSNAGLKDLKLNKNYFYAWGDSYDKMANDEKISKSIRNAPSHSTEELNGFDKIPKEQKSINNPNYAVNGKNFNKYGRKSPENHFKKNYDSGSASKSPNLWRRSKSITGLRSSRFDQKDTRKHVSHLLSGKSENQRSGPPKTYPRSLIRTKYWEENIHAKSLYDIETSTNGHVPKFEPQPKISPSNGMNRPFSNSYFLFIVLCINLLLYLIYYLCQRRKKIGPVFYKKIDQSEDLLEGPPISPSLHFQPIQSHTESVVVNIEYIETLPFLDVLAYNGYLNPFEDMEPTSLKMHAGTSTRSSLASELMMNFDSPDPEFSLKSDVPHETHGTDLNVSQVPSSPGIGLSKWSLTVVSDSLETSKTKNHHGTLENSTLISTTNFRISRNVEKDGLSSTNSSTISILETWNSKCGYDSYVERALSPREISVPILTAREARFMSCPCLSNAIKENLNGSDTSKSSASDLVFETAINFHNEGVRRPHI